MCTFIIQSEISVNVTLRESDGKFSANMIDTAKLTVPFKHTTEFTEVDGINGTFRIVQFNFSYNIPSKVEDVLGNF